MKEYTHTIEITMKVEYIVDANFDDEARDKVMEYFNEDYADYEEDCSTSFGNADAWEIHKLKFSWNKDNDDKETD